MKRLHPHSLSNTTAYDILIIGGGATGLGTALDAASRGLKTLLVEQADFAKGTSSRSTKLVHGGVRYLAQGNIRLVQHALEERGLLQQNASHLVEQETFIIPCYDWLSLLKYRIGLGLYDFLSGKYSFDKSAYLSKTETMQLLPGLKTKGLKGGIRYYDGEFDDARLAINIAQSAVAQGANLINYMQVKGLLKDIEGAVTGANILDVITGESFSIKARVVVNATGVFVDDILKMHDPASKNMVRPSQGVHIVLNKKFMNSNVALMIPKTTDGRVLFAVPWHDRLLIGTTDTPVDLHSLEPRALPQEVDFILKTASGYFSSEVKRSDILSIFAGLRPLAAPTYTTKGTKEISRDHKLMVSAKGLITITGGKWTTYRRMAEETVNLAVSHARLKALPCSTKTLPIHGNGQSTSDTNALNSYGTDRKHIEALLKKHPELNQQLHPDFPHTHAEVIWCIRNEFAETVEDILSRRLRVLFTDAQAAKFMTPAVARLLADELNADQEWIEEQLVAFTALADGYLYTED